MAMKRGLHELSEPGRAQDQLMIPTDELVALFTSGVTDARPAFRTSNSRKRGKKRCTRYGHNPFWRHSLDRNDRKSHAG